MKTNITSHRGLHFGARSKSSLPGAAAGLLLVATLASHAFGVSSRPTGIRNATLGASLLPPSGTVIYNNGAPNLANGNEMTQWMQAEDFTLASPAVVNDVIFWDIEATSAYQGSIYWSINANNAGTPGAQLFSGTEAAVTRTATGGSAFGLTEFQNEFSIAPVSIPAGSYWLELHNGPVTSTTRADFYWETTGTGAGVFGQEDVAPFGDGFSSNGQEHAFELLNVEAVPEPSTWAWGLSLLGAVAFPRVRRRSAKG